MIEGIWTIKTIYLKRKKLLLCIFQNIRNNMTQCTTEALHLHSSSLLNNVSVQQRNKLFWNKYCIVLSTVPLLIEQILKCLFIVTEIKDFTHTIWLYIYTMIPFSWWNVYLPVHYMLRLVNKHCFHLYIPLFLSCNICLLLIIIAKNMIFVPFLWFAGYCLHEWWI